MLTPPSAPAVILASIAGVSLEGFITAGVIPGILLAAFLSTYLILMSGLDFVAQRTIAFIPHPLLLSFSDFPTSLRRNRRVSLRFAGPEPSGFVSRKRFGGEQLLGLKPAL